MGSAAALGLSLAGMVFGAGDEAAPVRGFAPDRAGVERALEQAFKRIPDAKHAEANLQRLTSEPHMAGTEASHRVAEWLRDQYRSYGFSSELVSYSAWLSEPLEVKLELISPGRKILATREQPFEADRDTYDPRAVVGFNAYSPSGDVSAPVIYVNYGLPEDYRQLDVLGIRVAGKIVIARYGRSYRGVKAKIAEERQAAGLLIYSDPAEGGSVVGDTQASGGRDRPLSGIQRGSIQYSFDYPGDPLTPGVAATEHAKRLAPSQARNLPRIPTLPISAETAATILERMDGARAPRGWQGGLPFAYHLGPGRAAVHMTLKMDNRQRPIWDVISRLPGASDTEWVLLGNHHDAWVFGAADPSSGTAVLLETARALGELSRAGWKPRRTIVICEWDAEEPGLIGSTEWVEEHEAELRRKAVAYVNVDVGVAGAQFGAAATPTLKELVRDVTREVADPRTGLSVYDVWREQAARGPAGRAAGSELPPATVREDALLGALGGGSDFTPFFEHAGIPAMDLGFGGDYGVYHALYDDFYWMKHFGDPSFAYHAALARIVGLLALRLADADFVPLDYDAYSREIQRSLSQLERAAESAGGTDKLDLGAVISSAAAFESSAGRAMKAVRDIDAAGDSPRDEALNRALVEVEQELLDPQGLAGRPWYRHTLFAPGAYAGYAPVLLPGVREAVDRRDWATAREQAAAVAAALTRGAARLDAAAHLAGEIAAANSATHERSAGGGTH